MIRPAQWLPLVAVVMWGLTLFVPVFDSGNVGSPRIQLNSLGTPVLTLDTVRASDDLQTPFILSWVGVLACAGSGWLLRRWRAWSIVTIVIALAITWFFVQMLIDPPFLIWDGLDAQGRPTGGYEEAGPAWGAIAWVIGIAALFGAGVSGLRRPKQHR